jgi:hypothetical protein
MKPSEIARLANVDVEAVYGWIASGQLAAFNAARNPRGRPRWRITVEAWEAFKATRSNRPTQSAKRNSQKPLRGVISFF